jgi:hypothetical protein
MVGVRADMRVAMHKSRMERFMIRLWNPTTNGYLHLSGRGEVSSADWSWLGLPKQAEALRNRALKRGEDWPYRAVPKNENEHSDGEQEV